MRNDFCVHEANETRIKPGSLLIPLSMNSDGPILPSKSFDRQCFYWIGAVPYTKVLPVPAEQQADDMSVMLTTSNFIVRLIMSLCRSDKFRTRRQSIEITRLILKHVVLCLLARDDVALMNLDCEVCQCCKHRNRTKKFGDRSKCFPVHEALSADA